MKKILIPIILILFAGTYGYYFALPKPEGDRLPMAEISPATHDFGEIEFGAVVSYEFTIVNNGETDLEIRRVATSCACTSADTDKKLIAPGDSAVLTVVYDSAAMGRSHAAGREERIVYIRTNDPASPQMEVTVYATII